MDIKKVKKIKKILESYEEENQYFKGIFCTMYFELAQEICQLFEPKSNVPLARICNEEHTSGVATGTNKPKPGGKTYILAEEQIMSPWPESPTAKPDESRLIGDATITLILEELEKYGYDKSPLICIQNGAKAQLAEDQKRVQAERKKYTEVLDFARGAIVDAICCEDGLDGNTGNEVIKWISEVLGDYDEFIKSHSEEALKKQEGIA